jgi:nitrite reductase/ring-hydroxylating ferredoxin subunit
VFENRCPHLGASLPWQRNEYLNAHGTRIVCSAHGAQFDIRSGQCTDGPAIGHALRRIATTIDERGVIIARRSDLPSYLALASID